MPEGLRNYKKREKLFYVRLVAGTKAFFGGFVSIPRRIAAWLGAKTTIVFIPHSEAPSRRFGISRFLLGLTGISFVALVVFSLFSATRYTAVRIQLRIAQGRAAEASAAVDELRDGAETLMGSALRFESKLAELLAVGAQGGLKQSAVPAEQALKAAMALGVQEVDLIVKGPGPGRESAIRSMQSIGIRVRSISDVTPVPHNGCRPPKKRRV